MFDILVIGRSGRVIWEYLNFQNEKSNKFSIFENEKNRCYIVKYIKTNLLPNTILQLFFSKKYINYIHLLNINFFLILKIIRNNY